MAWPLLGAKPLFEIMLEHCKWDPRNKFQWNFNGNSYILIHENPFENIVGKMAPILSSPQYVNIFIITSECNKIFIHSLDLSVDTVSVILRLRSAIFPLKRPPIYSCRLYVFCNLPDILRYLVQQPLTLGVNSHNGMSDGNYYGLNTRHVMFSSNVLCVVQQNLVLPHNVLNILYFNPHFESILTWKCWRIARCWWEEVLDDW